MLPATAPLHLIVGDGTIFTMRLHYHYSHMHHRHDRHHHQDKGVIDIDSDTHDPVQAEASLVSTVWHVYGVMMNSDLRG